MRRVLVVVVLAVAATVWPAANGLASSSAGTRAAAAAGSRQADFNHDGFADLAVGVPFEDIGSISDAGAVNVLYGSATGLTGINDQQFWQGAAGVVDTAEVGDEFGTALAAGDFNNDGFADLAVGALGESFGSTVAAGAVTVLYGSAGGLTGTGSQLFRQGAGGVAGAAEAFDLFGLRLSAGDFNHDGFADLAVGVPFEDIGAVQDAGAVNVLYGSAGGLTGTGSQAFWQGAGGVAGTAELDDRFGTALAAGDFNNNGASDLAIGVPSEDIGTVQNAGAVNVLYGSASGLSGSGDQQFWQGPGGAAGTLEAGDGFGDALAAGDFNNNGIGDLAIGVPVEDIGGRSAAGAVDVLYGGSAGGLTGTGSQAFWQGAGGVAGTAEEEDLFGRELAAGDFNNNGIDDLAVGVPFEDIGAIRGAGAVNVLYGSAGGLTGTGSQAFWQGAGGVAGTAEGDDQFGWAISAGDFNNNGIDDLAVGVPFEDIGTIPDAGAVNTLSGSANGLTGTGGLLLRQGAGGVAGTAEVDDEFGQSLVASDQPTSPSATAASPSKSKTPSPAPTRNR